MAMYYGDDALYGTLAPRTVGTAVVCDVVKLTYDPGTMDAPDYPGVIVGRIVQRDGVLYARDTSSCGESLVLAPDMLQTLKSMLRYASGHLFA